MAGDEGNSDIISGGPVIKITGETQGEKHGINLYPEHDIFGAKYFILKCFPRQVSNLRIKKRVTRT